MNECWTGVGIQNGDQYKTIILEIMKIKLQHRKEWMGQEERETEQFIAGLSWCDPQKREVRCLKSRWHNNLWSNVQAFQKQKYKDRKMWRNVVNDDNIKLDLTIFPLFFSIYSMP